MHVRKSWRVCAGATDLSELRSLFNKQISESIRQWHTLVGFFGAAHKSFGFLENEFIV
jgi:hypothetical protein